MRATHVSNLLLIAALGCLAGCDEEKPATVTTAAEPVKPAPPPAATPEPAAAPAAVAPRPKKKLEDCPKEATVSFDNPDVEAQVRLKLQKPKGDITRADLGRLKSLNISQVQLDELDVCLFSQMTGLKELFLGTGNYDDLSPIAKSTKLESLRASVNQVRDVAPLAEMTKLDRLDLGRTQVSDLTPLANLTALTELQLDDTPVEDLKPLAKLEKLERLSIQRTRVKDATPLGGLKNLKFLYVAGTPLDEEQTTLAKVRANGTKVMSQ